MGEDKLVIVESPAKARTIEHFLGQGYEVKASVGHVWDLMKRKLSVDIENDFSPTYTVPSEKRQVVRELKEAARRAAEVYLATDPDREGEAIAWHLIQAARLKNRPVYRVVFHEITKPAIAEAFANPRGIDMQLVNAQQARRILDRLVGYKVSPLLWEKVKRGLSAGRVQSVAVRLVVEREREIQAFVSQEYWSIEAELAKVESENEEQETFLAKLVKVRGEEPQLGDQAAVEALLRELQVASYFVSRVEHKERRRNPLPPFTTSTLQQEASRRLRFSAQRTMRIAQQLYEGVELKEGSVGLITYMRTDSVHVSSLAQAEARSYIAETYGSEYLPPTAPQYKVRSKLAQEAHEAIRPTAVHRSPEAIKDFLTGDQYRVYSLIWRRYVASQMAPAILDITTVDIEASDTKGEKPYLFRATAPAVKFTGFLEVYKDVKEMREEHLPKLAMGEPLDLVRLIPEQHFTKPPPRYSEGTLVRALEENGVGRPSTYAPIISTIQKRGYVEQVDRMLQPTELGFIINDLLVEHFPAIMDIGFTAQMEEDLDAIATGRKDWVPVLREFYGPFAETLRRAEERMERVVIPAQPTGEPCELCGSPMVIKRGRFGKFIGCSGYPTCKNTKPYLEKIGVKCPQCGAEIAAKKSRKGRTFYGCSNYPDCKFASWRRPLPQACPECGGMVVAGARGSAQCSNCGTQVAIEEVESAVPG